MKNFFRSAGVFLKAVPHFLIFELIFKLMLLGIGTPVLALLLKLTMKLSGITYLNDENLLVYLKHPFTIVVIVLMLFCYAFFSFVELSALAACFSCYEKKQRIFTGGMFRTGIKSFVKAFKGAGIITFLGYMAVMPLAQFSLSAGMFMAPLMPVLRRIFYSVKSGAAIAAFVLLQLLFVMLIISGCYSIHYLILTKSPFSDCVKKSKEKIHGQRFKMILMLFAFSLGVFALIAVITFGLSFVIVFVIKGLKANAAFGTALSILGYAWSIFTAISAIRSSAALFTGLILPNMRSRLTTATRTSFG